MEQTITSGYDEQIADIEARMNEMQRKLVEVSTSKEESDSLTEDICKLREEKERIQILLVEDKGRQLKKEELIKFLSEQTAELDEFDDPLVRRLIDQVIIHENGRFTVEFKSGTSVEI
ncbi:MAG: hypothetical protein E7215_13475 [Clostridium sulfidigenes]|uniref:Resolvase n=1 Tax=Clostridium sulfidigenes TaxID=318464 RepID=A0A927WDF5_9CLOT|nr:hypothetical protein [Clostridium sulfidigenes]